jgi:hypothetical protein
MHITACLSPDEPRHSGRFAPRGSAFTSARLKQSERIQPNGKKRKLSCRALGTIAITRGSRSAAFSGQERLLKKLLLMSAAAAFGIPHENQRVMLVDPSTRMQYPASRNEKAGRPFGARPDGGTSHQW